MQPPTHSQSERDHFKYHIVLKWNYESTMALLPIVLFVTTDNYEKGGENRQDCDLWRM
jgi:hypothetical protein